MKKPVIRTDCPPDRIYHLDPNAVCEFDVDDDGNEIPGTRRYPFLDDVLALAPNDPIFGERLRAAAFAAEIARELTPPVWPCSWLNIPETKEES